MDQEQVSNTKPHVLVIPFIIQGHINPMLQFSKFLALKTSLKITFILTSTTTKIAKIPTDESIRIKFISDVPEEEIQEPNNNSPETFFKNLKPTVSKNLIELINEEKDAKVIVYDSVMPWILDIAHEKGLLGAAFFTHSCSVSALHYHLKQGTLRYPFELNSEISLPFMPSLDIRDLPSYSSDNIFMDPLKFHVDQFSNIERVDWIFFNTFEKLETEIAKWMSSQWPIKTIGPTCLLPKTSRSQIEIEANNEECIKWLDSKDAGSVVYVSFGSMVSLKEEQMEELGQGLLMSKCNFFTNQNTTNNFQTKIMFVHAVDYQENIWLSKIIYLPLIFFTLVLIKRWFSSQKPLKSTPPSPPKLPLIGNLHQIGSKPHKNLQSLAQKHGPLMLLHMGNVPLLVVSSPDLAKEILKTHDPIFSNRPKSSVANGIYECKDIAFSAYGEYWRQVKSICVYQLLSNRKVQSFRNVREEEVSLMIEKIKKSCNEKKVINLGEMFAFLANDIICRVALGKKYNDGEKGKKFKEVLETLGVLLGAFNVGEFIPWLFWIKYVNGMDAKVRKVARQIDDFLEFVVEEHKNEIRRMGNEDNKNGKDFVDVLLEIQRSEESGFALDSISIKALILISNLLSILFLTSHCTIISYFVKTHTHTHTHTMETQEISTKSHILAIPFPLQGHINPMIQLCKRLVSKTINVTLVTTASISKSIQIQATNNLINIETVPDLTINENEHLDLYEIFIQSFKASITTGLLEIIQKQNRNSGFHYKAILYDSVIPWTLDIAREQGLKGAVLFTQPCTVCSLFYHLGKGTLEIPHDENTEVSLPGMPVLRLKDLPSLVYDTSSYPSLLRLLIDQFSTFEKADWRLFNTFDKLEDEILKWMANQYPILTIGPTIPSMYIDKRLQGNYDYGLSFFKPNSDESCMKWLDTKEDHSKQMNELYEGLINTGYNFLWVVKDPKESKLPQDFISNPTEQGLIVNWCAQLEVLSHRAIGCFITHCGWNSTLEALSLGVPMVAMPQWTDQTTNAKLIADVWGVGVRVKSDENGIVSREEIVACVKNVMEGERGIEMRRNAMNLKNLAIESVGEGGSSDKNATDFAMELLRS
ncbi:hypothetical protein ACJIZ3_009845 [Penstemon smallii]|uniref:anthocyanidin 3-O-glucoside 5-O-glucosyltransferase n=1 Tax=Penstemon smallii TaxID=265156 RepID=A0ABD3TDN6_9LAMI